MKWCIIVLAVALLLPLEAHAFSEDFKREMTALQDRVMLKGERFSPGDMKKWWKRFDDEIIGLLSKQKSPNEDELNKEGEKRELTVTEHRGTEIEEIELGDISAYFQQMDTKGQIWLVILHNRMYQGSTPLPFGTIHVFKEVDGKFTRTTALEEMQGPWDKEQIQLGSIQFQNLGGTRKNVKFATYHAPPKKVGEARPSRSKIIWEYRDDLKAVDYNPKVD